MSHLSERAKNLKTSPTLKLVAQAKELAAKGHDVVSLTVGEPDWETFPAVAAAGIEAIQKGITKYTAASGTIELRKVIAKKIKNDFNADYSPAEVLVGPGAKFVIFSALQVLCSRGDEVIMSAPYWVSYPTMVELADAKPVIVQCDEDSHYKLTAAQLRQAITKNTRAFLFCSPSNPTGLTYTESELKELAEVFRQHPQIFIISDDMYNRLNFDGQSIAPHFLKVAPDLKDRIIAVNGGSKAYAMTGWRMGWATGPAALIKAMGDYQSQSTGAPSSIAQHALEVGLQACEPDIQAVVQKLIQRKKSGMKVLSSVPGLRVVEPDGAFYFWIDIKSYFGKSHKGRKLNNSSEFCDVLLNEYFVATVPGIECGSEGYVRLSFATSEEQFAEGIRRLKVMVESLVK